MSKQPLYTYRPDFIKGSGFQVWQNGYVPFKIADVESESKAKFIVRSLQSNLEITVFLEQFIAGYISDEALLPEAKRILERVKNEPVAG